MDNKSYIQAMEYIVTNVSTFILDIILIWVMVSFWNINYIWAVTIGYIVAITLNYFINRDWTYKGTHMKITKGYFKSLSFSIFFFLIIIGLMFLFVDILKFNYIISRFFVGIFCGTTAYILETIFTFKMHLIYRLKKK